MKERKHALNEKKLVGVTCASTKQDILANQEFPIVILDESSQVLLHVIPSATKPVLFHINLLEWTGH